MELCSGCSLLPDVVRVLNHVTVSDEERVKAAYWFFRQCMECKKKKKQQVKGYASLADSTVTRAVAVLAVFVGVSEKAGQGLGRLRFGTPDISSQPWATDWCSEQHPHP